MSATATQEKVVIDSKTYTNLQPPGLHRVIYINDNITTMEFVTSTLIEVFNHNVESAQELTQKIHNDGAATVAILPYEIAEHKGVAVTLLARSNNFPLQIKIEPE